jgi:hypothetical protein
MSANPMNDPHCADRSAIVAKLIQTQPWLRFIAIMMLIGTGLMMLAGAGLMLFGILNATGVLPAGESESNVLLLPMGFLYFVLSFLYLWPALYLLRSARAIRGLASDPQDSAILVALENHRRFWKFVGITTIVFIVFYVIIIVAAVALPILQAAQAAAKHAN